MNIIRKIINWFTGLFRVEGKEMFAPRIVKPRVIGKTRARLKVVLGEMISKTAGGHHAWYDSNVGRIRKPL